MKLRREKSDSPISPRGMRKLQRNLSRLPPMRVNPKVDLISAYFKVRNALNDGGDPSQVEVEWAEDPDGVPIMALPYFLAALRYQGGVPEKFDRDDELAAYDVFAFGLLDQERRRRNSAESLNHREQELQKVRAYLASRP